MLHLVIEMEREADGRWIAEVISLPGVMAYGHTREEAIQAVHALTLRVLADRIESGETKIAGPLQISFATAA